MSWLPPEHRDVTRLQRRDHAERLQLLNPRYSFNPPIAHTIFHCAGVTGCTDRRAYLTSDMSFRRGAALTAVKVTAFGSGFTAFTSTALNTSFGSVGSG